MRFKTHERISYPEANWYAIQERSPHYVEVEDTGTADSVNYVAHGLGREPVGVKVVRCVLPTAAGDPACYQIDGDMWTDRVIGVRFSAANARVLLEIF